MTKLYQQIPIETWKRIAYKVQRLKLSDCSDEEFKTNLNILRKLLSDLDISLKEGKRIPEHESEIGIASLLHSILFSENVFHRYVKANFYEYIQRLSDLRIKSMEFRPVDFYFRVDELYLMRTHESQINSKCYTDGTFKLEYFQDSTGCLNYIMNDLKDESYLFDVEFKKYPDRNTLGIVKADACVKNFNGTRFPSKDELLRIGFPKVETSGKVINWGESPEYKQVFETFSYDDLSCSKRLTKTPNKVYYYKEYHNK